MATRVGSRPAGSGASSGAVAPNGDTLAVRGDVGVAGSIWCAADLPFGTPWDQREDESRSLVFEWAAPADAELEILGLPARRADRHVVGAGGVREREALLRRTRTAPRSSSRAAS